MTGAAHLGHVDFPNIDFFILTAKSKQTGSLRSGSFKARSLLCRKFLGKANMKIRTRDRQ